MIPQDVQRFLRTAIHSVPHLEALLLLRREPAIAWEASTLAPRLYVSAKRANELLHELADAGFLAADFAGRFHYEPATSEQAALVDRAAEAHARNLVEVTRLIHDNTASSARLFADAFRFRKD